MKFTRIPTNTFQSLQLNAGILLTSFTPATATITEANIIGATSGGMKFEAVPSFIDIGEDIDNCPKNMKELKQLEAYEIKMSGSFVTASAAMAKRLAGAADLSGTDVVKITPRNDVAQADYQDLWWVGDFSDKNGTNNGGFIAIHMMNTLSTGGFNIQSSDNGKGMFEFEFTAHYSMNAQSTVPFEIYIKSGTAESGDYEMTVTSVASSTTGSSTVTTSEAAGTGEQVRYQTGYSLSIPAEGTCTSGSAWANLIGTTVTGTTGMDVVVVIVNSTTLNTVHAGKTTLVVKEETT